MCLIWKQWPLCALFLLAGVAEATVFDVTKYGAKADGITDISKAVNSAWSAACASAVPSSVLIPKGTYLLGPVVLKGSCKSSSIGFQVEGIVVAPPNPAVFSEDWIIFRYVKGLTISGGGTFNGKGQTAWSNSDCYKNSDCKLLPVSLKFDFVTNTVVQYITSLNSKYFHIGLYKCVDLRLEHIKISAPGNSPNTDGIHIANSERINVTDVNIGTGDDCISIGPGTRTLTVTKVVCGPGHGISVGSLGRYKGEEEVNGVYVKNCTLINTHNGVRIKTFPSSPDNGVASNIFFEDIIVENVFYPVILDQEYCPHSQCSKSAPSLIKLSNIRFNYIRGTTPFPLAVEITCSRAVPCEHLEIGSINLKYTGQEGQAQTICRNVNPIFYGQQIPPIQCGYTEITKPMLTT